jgi:hypothetical protein
MDDFPTFRKMHRIGGSKPGSLRWPARVQALALALPLLGWLLAQACLAPAHAHQLPSWALPILLLGWAGSHQAHAKQRRKHVVFIFIFLKNIFYRNIFLIS